MQQQKKVHKPKTVVNSSALTNSNLNVNEVLVDKTVEVIVEQPVTVEKVVEVVKEVPVEKVGKELVEVPKAYVVKEFVGVPVPTAPEDLPNYEEAEQENTIQGAPVLGGVQ